MGKIAQYLFCLLHQLQNSLTDGVRQLMGINPLTSDDSNTILWFALAIAGLGGAGITIFLLMKKRKEQASTDGEDHQPLPLSQSSATIPALKNDDADSQHSENGDDED